MIQIFNPYMNDCFKETKDKKLEIKKENDEIESSKKFDRIKREYSREKQQMLSEDNIKFTDYTISDSELEIFPGILMDHSDEIDQDQDATKCSWKPALEFLTRKSIGISIIAVAAIISIFVTEIPLVFETISNTINIALFNGLIPFSLGLHVLIKTRDEGRCKWFCILFVALYLSCFTVISGGGSNYSDVVLDHCAI